MEGVTVFLVLYFSFIRKTIRIFISFKQYNYFNILIHAYFRLYIADLESKQTKQNRIVDLSYERNKKECVFNSLCAKISRREQFWRPWEKKQKLIRWTLLKKFKFRNSNSLYNYCCYFFHYCLVRTCTWNSGTNVISKNKNQKYPQKFYTKTVRDSKPLIEYLFSMLSIRWYVKCIRMMLCKEKHDLRLVWKQKNRLKWTA